jgi:Ca2+-dependent lipid-binding protein
MTSSKIQSISHLEVHDIPLSRHRSTFMKKSSENTKNNASNNYIDDFVEPKVNEPINYRRGHTPYKVKVERLRRR